jgi:GxxExxY protein
MRLSVPQWKCIESWVEVFWSRFIRKPLLSNSANETFFIYAKQAFPYSTKEVELNVPYRPDFICCDNVVLELKVLARITGIEQSQVINYLKVTGHEIGLLLNFGTRSLDYRRLVLTNS